MISVSTSVGGRAVGADYATPQERQTDDACAAQDGAAATSEKASSAAHPEPASRLDQLRDDPGALARFGAR